MSNYAQKFMYMQVNMLYCYYLCQQGGRYVIVLSIIL